MYFGLFLSCPWWLYCMFFTMKPAIWSLVFITYKAKSDSTDQMWFNVVSCVHWLLILLFDEDPQGASITQSCHLGFIFLVSIFQTLLLNILHISMIMDIWPFQSPCSHEGEGPSYVKQLMNCVCLTDVIIQIQPFLPQKIILACLSACKSKQKTCFSVFLTTDGLICFSAPDSPETIELEINTVSEEGLILWQGVVCLHTWAPYWISEHIHSGSKINNIYC